MLARATALPAFRPVLPARASFVRPDSSRSRLVSSLVPSSPSLSSRENPANAFPRAACRQRRRSIGAISATGATSTTGGSGVFSSSFASFSLGRQSRGVVTTRPVRMAATDAGDASTLVATHGEESCIFCKIRDGKIPSHKVLETEHCLAILDAFPMARGHALLIPKKHYAFMEEMPDDEAAEMLKLLPTLSRAIRKATGAEGVNIFQNNGGPAGQVVFHVHVHVLPRTEADGLLAFGKSGPMIDAEEAKEVKEALAGALSA